MHHDARACTYAHTHNVKNTSLKKYAQRNLLCIWPWFPVIFSHHSIYRLLVDFGDYFLHAPLWERVMQTTTYGKHCCVHSYGGLMPQAWPSSNWVGFLTVTPLAYHSQAWDSLPHGGRRMKTPWPLSIPLSAFTSITVFSWVGNDLVRVSVCWLLTCRPKLCGRFTIGHCNPSIYNGAGCIVDVQ